MYWPKPIYESLPYLGVIGGALCMMAGASNLFTALFGLALLAANLLALKLRMYNRARHARMERRNWTRRRQSRKLVWWPEPLYESLPYLGVILGAALMLMASANPLLSLFGALVVLISLLILSIRISYRTRYGKRPGSR